MMQLHRRQFAIGPEQFCLNDTWTTYALGDSLWLSTCPDLHAIKATDMDGQDWYMLGHAVEALQKKSSPESEIARTTSDRVPDLCASWAGRWVLVGNGHLYLDACGLLGCFYGKDFEHRLWASSSAALLAQLVSPTRSLPTDPRQLTYEVGIAWYTPPYSRFEGISRLLPSQVLELQSGKLQPKLLVPDISLKRDYEDLLAEIQQVLLTTLKGLSEFSSQIWLGLTAGYDSRLMLALSQHANIQVQPFTRLTLRMSVADRVLPPQLVKASDFTHTFVSNQKRYPDRIGLAEAHTAGHVSRGDAEPLIQGARDRLRGISFGGHGFAIASGFSRLHALPERIVNTEETAKQIAKVFQEPADSSAVRGIQTWLNWTVSHPQPNLSWRDRFFLEQRQAGWLSSKEQLYDLTDLVRFPVLNSAYLYSLILSIRERKRLGSKLQEDLIKRLSPELAKYPYNPGDAYFSLLEIFASKSKDLPGYVLSKLSKKVRWMWNSLTLRY